MSRVSRLFPSELEALSKRIGDSFQAEPISMQDIKEEQYFEYVFIDTVILSHNKKKVGFSKLVFLSQTHSAESCLASPTT